MHIPDSMLQGTICPVTASFSLIGIILAAWRSLRTPDQPSPARFGAVAAMIFACQMLNFPVMHGTSGHLLGGVVAASLLGIPSGILAIALVVAVQSLVFSDGGIIVLGANIFNMALIGAGAGGWIYHKLLARTKTANGRHLAAMSAAWFSVMLAALAVSLELALDGQIALITVLPAMLGAHALIGVGEAIITAALCAAFASVPASGGVRRMALAPLVAAVVMALLLSPMASSWPDGLEWVAAKYEFLHESAPAFTGLLPDYILPGIRNAWSAGGLAGLFGVVVTFAVGWGARRILAVRAAPVT